MAKKDFTMKFAGPKVKGSNQSVEDKAEPQAEPQIINTEKNRPVENPKVESLKAPENSDDDSKDKKAKSVAKLLAEPKKSNSEFGENPFLQSKEHFDPASVIKTGYKMRTDYKTVLKLMAEIKKGYTIEALLDDALTMYLGNTPEAQKAIQMMRLMK